MDRQTVYPLAIPYETDFLSAQRFAQEGLGLLAQDILGPGPVAIGLGCGPTSPASLAVVISPGRLYQMSFLDGAAYGQITGGNPAGGLAADVSPSHEVLKQGLLRDQVALPCPAPSTAGTSISYLIEAMFQEVDTNPSVLQFFNTQNPSTPLAGPNGTGVTLPTVRACQCIVQAKSGIAATTGTQATPAPDIGWIGLYAVTVTYGQTAIIAGNISILPGAPFLSSSLPQIIQSLGAPPGTYAVDTSATPNVITASLSPALSSYQTGFVFRIKPANANTNAVVASINGLPNVSLLKPDGAGLVPGDLRPGRVFDVVVNAGPVLQMLSWPQTKPDKGIQVISAALSGFTASAHNHYPVDTSGGAVSCNLDPAPIYGEEIGFSDAGGAWKTNNLTIQGNGNLINGSASNFVCNLNNASFTLVFRGGSYGWKVE
jgi:hypothetical protein